MYYMVMHVHVHKSNNNNWNPAQTDLFVTLNVTGNIKLAVAEKRNLNTKTTPICRSIQKNPGWDITHSYITNIFYYRMLLSGILLASYFRVLIYNKLFCKFHIFKNRAKFIVLNKFSRNAL